MNTSEVKTKQESLTNYIEDLVQKKVLPFFKQYLTQIYDENINIVVDFKDGMMDVKIGADKYSEYIHYHISEEIIDINDIGEQLTTFQDVTGEKLAHQIKLPRKEVDTLHLIHEFAHKFHWNLMRDNNSYQELKQFKRDYYFPIVDILKKFGGKINAKNPYEVYKYIKELIDTENENINEESEFKQEIAFLKKEIRGIPLLDLAFDQYRMDSNLGIDVDETFAKSVERIYIENADLSDEVKNALLTYRQDWFEKHPIIETIDEESKTSKTYSDEVFFRLYNIVGQDKFIELLKSANYFELAKMRIKDAQNQEYSKEYLEFLQNPVKYMQLIGKEIDSNGFIEDIFKMLSSEQADELGIDVKKYSKQESNALENINKNTLESGTIATEGSVREGEINDELSAIIEEFEQKNRKRTSKIIYTIDK